MSNHLVTATQLAAMEESKTVHQFDPNAIRWSRSLSAATGLQRIGIHLVRIEPGHASTTHHYHEADEEFIYVLAGRGIARIGQEEYTVQVGDFMGFSTPSAPHSLSNPFEEDLVYLMGGERNLPDIVHYPDLQRSMIKTLDGKRQYVDQPNLHSVTTRN